MDLKKGNNVPAGHYGMPYMDFMGHISRARNSRRYLEVGVSHGYLMSQIYTDRAIGVDPCYQIVANVAKNKKSSLSFKSQAIRFSPSSISTKSVEPVQI